MLSSVLRSDRAIQMSIAIVRTFVRMRELMESNREIAACVEKLERGHDCTASVIEVLVDDIDRLAREVKDMKALPPAKNDASVSSSTTIEPARNWRSQSVTDQK
jgi:NADH:ubiquinone oxidoreductase subunit D